VHIDSELAPFVSELGRSWLRDAPELTERELPGTLVFADISGFTRLTERLARRGRIGAEEMSDHLDRVLSALLTDAYEHGGRLLKWGGDALLLMYDGAGHVEQACAASASLQSLIRTVGVLESSVGRVRLRMSIGVHTGQFAFHFVGQRHRELLITGDAATTTAKLEATAEAGEILVSPEVARLLPAACCGAAKGDGFLLAHAPPAALVTAGVAVPSSDVTALVPELVLEHLRHGGGSGEHRQVTIAFLELSGMAALRRAEGPAAVAAGVRHVVDVTQEACHRNAVSFHETDISSDGGKIMLVAGAPRGLEDPAEAMLCTLRQVFDEPGPLALRAGVTSGQAFTGSVGPARRRSYSVKGDVVNLAARIMGKTPPGEIWALPTVVEASRTRFALGDVPPFSVKGKVATVTVKSVGQPLARIEADVELPLVGRTDEMDVLQSGLAQARQANGFHIDLIGPAGIGKTRLLAELRAAPDVRVLATAAEPYLASSPYSLVRPLLRDAFGVSDAPAGDLAEALERWCRDRAPEQRAWLPLLGPVLGTAIADTAATRDLAAEFRAGRMRELVLDLLSRAWPDPTLLVVDDMQFADDASEDLLRHIARGAGEQPWLVVLAGRAAPHDADAPSDRSRLLTVGPLTAEASLVLATADTDDAPLQPHVAAAVVGRSGGNPSFLRQLAATARTVADIDELPGTIEMVVAARIDGLRPAARDVLRAAATAGMTVERDLLTELLAAEATRPDDVVAELEEFLAADGAELRFRQAVIRDTAYAGLAFRRRTALHRRLAELLAARHAGDTAQVDAVLSVHYLEGGDNDRALRCARAAADRAAVAFANADAAVLYGRAITACGRQPGNARPLRAELHERRGDVEVVLGEYEQSDRSYAAAARLLRDDPLAVARIGLKSARSAADRRGAFGLALRRLRRITEVLEGVPGADAADLRLAIQVRTAFARFRQGRLTAARVSCLAVLEHGDDERNPVVMADALALLDVVEGSLGMEGDPSRAARALRLLDRLGDLASQARVHTQIGYRAYFAGRWDDAVASYERGRELIERVGDLPNAALARANIAEVLLDQGRLAEAEVALREVLRVSRASGSANDAAFAHALLGRTLARQGRHDEAELLLQQARAGFAEQGAKVDVVDTDVYLAESLLLRGRPADALLHAEQTARSADRLPEEPTQGSLLQRIIGACQDALGQPDAADAAYDLALDLARRRGADHDIAFTVAAMVARAAIVGRAVDPALVAEAAPLQRRLGLVLDLTAAETRPAVVLPSPRVAADLTMDVPVS
jgi:class 3 adenylate cyclase/tetratricopeptide (TPR) repeat protein